MGRLFVRAKFYESKQVFTTWKTTYLTVNSTRSVWLVELVRDKKNNKKIEEKSSNKMYKKCLRGENYQTSSKTLYCTCRIRERERENKLASTRRLCTF